MTLSMAVRPEGAAYISFERHHRILRYPFSAQSSDHPRAHSRFHPVSGCARTAGSKPLLRFGPPKGTTLSENLTDNNGNLQGWLIGGPTPGPFTLKRIEGFDVTDAVVPSRRRTHRTRAPLSL
jgi:hypothetical protein